MLSALSPFSVGSTAVLLLLGSLAPLTVSAQEEHSAAREWNQALLFAIRRDFARPTVHARNLFHISAAMYDSWAVYQVDTSPYFLGRSQANGFSCGLERTPRRCRLAITFANIDEWFNCQKKNK